MIEDAPCYVLNTVIGRDFQTLTVEEEIRRYSSQYSACLNAHTNEYLDTGKQEIDCIYIVYKLSLHKGHN
jgi:hypothetical protein